MTRSSTTYTECIFVFLLLQWLRERATLLRHTCIACLDPPPCCMSRSFHTPRVNHLSKVRIMELLRLKFSLFSFVPCCSISNRFFPCLRHSHQQWVPPSVLFHGYRRLFSGIKPSSCEIKNEWKLLYPLPCMPSWCVQGKIYLKP